MMAGLLDIFGTDEGRMGLGLLMAAAPRTDGGGFGQRLGDAFRFADSQRSAEEDRKMKQQQAELQRQEIGLKLQDYGMRMSDAQRAKAVAVAQKAYLDSGRKDPNEMLSVGFSPEQIKSIIGLKDVGTPEVARTIEVAGPGGQKQIIQLDRFGRPTGDALNGYTAPQLVNLGDKQVFATPQPGAAFPVGMSPADRDASARGWAGNALAKQRLEMDRSQASEGGKPPAGYRWRHDGSLEPIPGGPAGEGKPLTEAQGKATTYLGQMQASSKELSGLSDQGVKPYPSTVGLASSNWTNFLATKGAQQVAQSQNQWAEAYLRAKTGAAATEKEVELNRKTYFPQPGDSDAVIKQKESMRMQAEHDLLPQTGHGAKTLGMAPSMQTAVAPVQIKSEAHYRMLAKGTKYVAPDGSIREK
jgi:hypothetical protein